MFRSPMKGLAKVALWGARKLRAATLDPVRYVKNRLLHYKGPDPLKVIITGPPRSGTSFVAGLVVRMGFSPGPKEWLKPPDEHNRYGYYECEPLKAIEKAILTRLGGDFHHLPSLSDGWTRGFQEEERQITRLVRRGGIEVYKGNRLMVLADLCHEIFPDAKWIFCARETEQTYRSRFGGDITLDEWREITAARLEAWRSSRASDGALVADYDDFKADTQGTVQRIQRFLGVDLSRRQLDECIGFFAPRS